MPQTSFHCLLLVMAAFYIKAFVSFVVSAYHITDLGAVDELSQWDISVVAKDMDITEGTSSAVLELDTEEVANIRRRTAAELDGDGRSVIGYENVS